MHLVPFRTQFALSPSPCFPILNVAVVATITQQPASQSALAGGTVNLGVAVSGAAPLAYQWRRDGYDIAGASGSNLTLQSVIAADIGDYTVQVGNTSASVISQPTINSQQQTGMNPTKIIALFNPADPI